jgi:hypothetical protein
MHTHAPQRTRRHAAPPQAAVTASGSAQQETQAPSYQDQDIYSAVHSDSEADSEASQEMDLVVIGGDGDAAADRDPHAQTQMQTQTRPGSNSLEGHAVRGNVGESDARRQPGGDVPAVDERLASGSRAGSSAAAHRDAVTDQRTSSGRGDSGQGSHAQDSESGEGRFAAVHDQQPAGDDAKRGGHGVSHTGSDDHVSDGSSHEQVSRRGDGGYAQIDAMETAGRASANTHAGQSMVSADGHSLHAAGGVTNGRNSRGVSLP